LKLEDALINNKKSILELQSSNSDTSLVADLRNMAVNLIHQLTSETRREVKEEQNHRKFIFCLLIILFDCLICISKIEQALLAPRIQLFLYRSPLLQID
jgi:uncharacterized protein YejL (UPF0352 family)